MQLRKTVRLPRAGLGDRTLQALSHPANACHADGAVVMSLVSHTIVFSRWRACRIVHLLPPVRSPVAARERADGTTPLPEALRIRSRGGQRNQRRTQCRHAPSLAARIGVARSKREPPAGLAKRLMPAWPALSMHGTTTCLLYTSPSPRDHG